MSRHLKDFGLLRATQASGVSGPSWVTAGGAHGHPKPKRRPGNNGDIGGGGGKTVKKRKKWWRWTPLHLHHLIITVLALAFAAFAFALALAFESARAAPSHIDVTRTPGGRPL